VGDGIQVAREQPIDQVSHPGAARSGGRDVHQPLSGSSAFATAADNPTSRRNA